MARFGNANIMLHYKFIIIIILNLSVFFFSVLNGMLCTKYIIIFSLENSMAQALYLTRQHYRRTVPSGVDNDRIITRPIRHIT